MTFSAAKHDIFRIESSTKQEYFKISHDGSVYVNGNILNTNTTLPPSPSQQSDSARKHNRTLRADRKVVDGFR